MVYPEDYTYMSPAEKDRNIGYVSRLNEENGLVVLVDAFIELKKNKEFEDVKLILTGGSTGDDKKFLKRINRKIKFAGLKNYVEIHPEFEDDGLQDYFKKVSVISVPVLNGEAFGIYLLESMASGIPVIQPAAGAFPEIINTARGGKLFEPRNSSDLAKSLMELLSDPKEHERLSKAGREGVEKHFHIDKQVEKMIEIYQTVSTPDTSGSTLAH